MLPIKCTALLPILIVTRFFLNINAENRHWDMAVAAEDRIELILSNGTSIDTLDRWTNVKAVTFDAIRQELIVGNQNGHNVTVNRVLNDEKEFKYEAIIVDAHDDVQGLVHDPIDNILYITDASYHPSINYILLNGTDRQMRTLLYDPAKRPWGLAIDVCQRKIYWTNAAQHNPTLEMYDLLTNESQVLIDSDLIIPKHVALDAKESRLYWTDGVEGSICAIYSMHLDDRNRTKHMVHTRCSSYGGLAIGLDSIYFTYNKMLYVAPKTRQLFTPKEVQRFDEKTEALYMRDAIAPECESIRQITEVAKECLNGGRMMRNVCLCPDGFHGNACQHKSQPSKEESITEELECFNGGTSAQNVCLCPAGFHGNQCQYHEEPAKEVLQCFNGGTYQQSEQTCLCSEGFHGEQCQNVIQPAETFDTETEPIIRLQCFNGGKLLPGTEDKCQCSEHFQGEQCEHVTACYNYCLQGSCNLTIGGEAVCKCANGYWGKRCEKWGNECHRLCQERDNDTILTERGEFVCRCVNGEAIYNHTAPSYLSSPNSSSSISHLQDPIFLLMACLVLVLLVVSVTLTITLATKWRRRRRQPKIKKRIIVNRNVTPLKYTAQTTGGAIAANGNGAREHCEITIENCCNMNVCETPCFDPPKLACDDERHLLANMEQLEDLY